MHAIPRDTSEKHTETATDRQETRALPNTLSKKASVSAATDRANCACLERAVDLASESLIQSTSSLFRITPSSVSYNIDRHSATISRKMPRVELPALRVVMLSAMFQYEDYIFLWLVMKIS